MNKIGLIFLLILFPTIPLFGQYYTISGKVVDSKGKPIESATIALEIGQLWDITNAEGKFTIDNVPQGKNVLSAYCLGFAKKNIELNIENNISDLTIELADDNLSLKEVVITANRKSEDMTTSYLIDKAALDHAQILNVTDINSLLPGGKSSGKLNLATNDDRFSIRSSSTENGNPTFGTAIEVDGMRLDNNALLNESSVKGASTRGLSTQNIESIEVVAGIPSVEYGDLTNGIVKINTKKGKTPLAIELSTKPNTKQYGINKGFNLGNKAGMLNLGFEHAESNSDIASPYTTYDRNAFSSTYSNTFNRNRPNPIALEATIMGNIGGYNSKKDPDTFLDTYEKDRDNSIRGNIKLNWLLNKSWITNVEISGSFAYTDRINTINDNKSSSSNQPAIHGTEGGYYLSTSYDDDPNAPIIQLPTGYWYEKKYIDNKTIDYSLKAKANWSRKFGNISNNVLLGAEFKSSGNRGKGIYYDDLRYAPTWRPYPYKDLPYINNIAIYTEDRIIIPTRDRSNLQVTAGLRSDITKISQSEYGTVSSISPRFNSKYTFFENSDNTFQNLSLNLGWGKAVKLPSYEMLYPAPTYTDDLVFTTSGGKNNDGTENKIYGYNITPLKAIYNSDLKWQHSNQIELGFNTNISGVAITVSAFYHKTINPYIKTNVYTPYSYKGSQSIDQSFIIPEGDRVFSIDQATGIVTVSDKTGAIADQQLSYVEKETYKMNTMYTNGSDIKRSGLEWIIDFPKIDILSTSIRLDGNYYHYKGVEETLYAFKNPDLMDDGSPYKYIGYYPGGTANNSGSIVKNGSLSNEVNSNLTITTHIPQIRMIISMKVEASLYNYSRPLSEYSDGGSRGFVGDDGYFYLCPLYYSTWNDPNTKKTFANDYAYAKENDTKLYNELTKLVLKSSNKTDFNSSKISSYFSANISVTKEIGNFASISFYANNFLNSMQKVKSSKEDTKLSLYKSNYIPYFYYGLSLRLKF